MTSEPCLMFRKYKAAHRLNECVGVAGLQIHLELMDLRDCPPNYITEFQQAFEPRNRSSATLQHLIHSSELECAVTDMALLGTLEKGWAP